MKVEEFAAYAQIFESAVVAISVVAILMQLRQSVKLAKSANTQSLVSLVSPFNMGLIQDPMMAEYWQDGAELYQSKHRMNKVQRYQYKMMLMWWLVFHENVYYQNKQGLLEPTVYEGWRADLRDFLVRQHMYLHWPEMKQIFQYEFSNHIEALLREVEVDHKGSTVPANDKVKNS